MSMSTPTPTPMSIATPIRRIPMSIPTITPMSIFTSTLTLMGTAATNMTIAMSMPNMA